MEEKLRFSELPRHEIVRGIGQILVQLGLTVLAVSSVMRQFGNLPDQPITPPTFGGKQQDIDPRDSRRGYFD